jgi:hypothetical protein
MVVNYGKLDGRWLLASYDFINFWAYLIFQRGCAFLIDLKKKIILNWFFLFLNCYIVMIYQK